MIFIKQINRKILIYVMN